MQTSTNLSLWHSLAPVLPNPDSLIVYDPNASDSGGRFYRLERQLTMFRFRPAHSGVTDAEGLANQPGLKWKFKTEDEVFASPAVVDDTVYIGSCDAAVYALDATSGRKKWRTLLNGGNTMVFNAPAVWNGLVLSGTSLPPLFCALRADTGRQKWRFKTDGQVWSSPAVVDGSGDS
jgi:outer membrane protein assembly factor BamB